MVRETQLSPANFVLPLFAIPGAMQRKPVKTMPGVQQLSPDQIVLAAREAWSEGVPAVILFGIPEKKDAEGSSSHDPDGPVARSVASIKEALPDMMVITDVCMCEYTDHGHCGALTEKKNGVLDVDNDSTLALLAKEALCHVRAGADIVAPSDMMDGRVGHLRRALDEAGFTRVRTWRAAARPGGAGTLAMLVKV